ILVALRLVDDLVGDLVFVKILHVDRAAIGIARACLAHDDGIDRGLGGAMVVIDTERVGDGELLGSGTDRPKGLGPAALRLAQIASTESARSSGGAAAVASDQASTGWLFAGPGMGTTSPLDCRSAMATARLRTSAAADSFIWLIEATPVLPSLTTRTRTLTSRLATFWWMPLLAKRVRALSHSVTVTSVCAAGDACSSLSMKRLTSPSSV